MKTLHGLAASLLLLTGCAGYRLEPTTPEDAAAVHRSSQTKEGYIFYEPHPYVMGTLKGSKADDKGTSAEYDFQLVYLPDYDRPYRFTRYETLAKNDLKITFANGWMFTGAESSTDSTAALSAIADLIKAGIAAMNVGAGQAPEPVILYRLEYGSSKDEPGKTYFLRKIDLIETRRSKTP